MEKAEKLYFCTRARTLVADAYAYLRAYLASLSLFVTGVGTDALAATPDAEGGRGRAWGLSAYWHCSA